MEEISMVARTLSIWDKLIGPADKFSSDNRTVNAVGVITLLMLILLLFVGLLVGFTESVMLGIVLISVQAILYYVSRVRKQYQISIIIYACFCYIALILNYWYDAGITGPTIFLFFLTFQLLIAITPKPQHKVWAPLHVLIALALMLAEYLNPGLIQKTYPSREALFIDISASYLISLSFIYIITNYLLNKYRREKILAQERADAIEAQNKALKEIAWMQSHKVRSHVATILGLAEVIDSGADTLNNDKILADIKLVAKDLDVVIRDINKLTNDADSTNK